MNLSSAALGAAAFLLVGAITARPALAEQPAGFESALTQIRASVLSVRAGQIQAAAESLAGRIESASKEAGRLSGQALLVKAELGAVLKRLRDDQRDGLPISPSPQRSIRASRTLSSTWPAWPTTSSCKEPSRIAGRAARNGAGCRAVERLRAEVRAIDPEWIPIWLEGWRTSFCVSAAYTLSSKRGTFEQQAGNFARLARPRQRADILVLRAAQPAKP